MGRSPLRRALRLTSSVGLLGMAVLASGTDIARDGALSAGQFTLIASDANAFSLPVGALSKKQMEQFLAGREQFNEAWVVAPEPDGVWGLGPTFNEDRCAHCHVNNGRAKAPEHAEEGSRGLLVRLSIPGQTKEGAPNPHPAYGDQLQNRGIAGRVPAEGRVVFTYRPREVRLNDGEIIVLREPQMHYTDLQFGELGTGTMISARIAPAMIGLGLLEAVPEETILALAADQKKQGLGGRPNYVWDHENGRTVLGRFGWKANQPNVRQQTAAAFFTDIGATSQFFPEENCPAPQLQCLDLPSASKCGGQGGCTGNYRPEVVPSRLKNISFYLQTLAVPARRNAADAQVQRGEALFAQARCNACHVPRLQTGSQAAIDLGKHQVIHPYTDLLLHDMGEALADGRPDFRAGGRDWRTPPLWGIGLVPVVNGHSTLLHDGRARNVTEAILWHGGEAQASRDIFGAMTKPEREALVKFVESL